MRQSLSEKPSSSNRGCGRLRHGSLLPPLPPHLRSEPRAPARRLTDVPRRRDDLGQARGLQLRVAYGGNKIRKLDNLVPDAIAQGADTLVSIGGYQSNHTRQVAAVAAHRDELRAGAGEMGRLARTSSTTGSGNIMLSRIMGADVRLDDAGFDIGFRDSWQQAIVDVEAAGGTPYAIPAGACDHRLLGGLGFATGRGRSRSRSVQLGVFFDTILVCTVTGSTHAGHDRGVRGAGGGQRAPAARDRDRRLATFDKTRDQVARIARRTAEP